MELTERSNEVKTVFSKKVSGIGVFRMRPLSISGDMTIIHNWVNRPYARYWGMQGMSLAEVTQAHIQLLNRDNYEIFVGTLDEEVIFMTEKYNPSGDQLGTCYQVERGDCGMHVLVSPPDRKIKGFTWEVFCCILEFIFSDPMVERIVVEPDVRNDKIHILNKKAGFQYQDTIQLPNKKAHLAWCTRQDYWAAKEIILTDQNNS